MDLASYAALAVTLVNTGQPPAPDRLNNVEELRGLLADRPHLIARAKRSDLDVLRTLRDELRRVFEDAVSERAAEAVDRLNELLVRYPIHPQISGHDDQDWHLHLTESGCVSDQYGVGAVMGLATIVTDLGIDRLGMCGSVPCRQVFLDTSTNRSRRYCSDRCASRANVAAYRARQRTGGQ